MSTCVTILVFLFNVGGAFAPVNVPDGKGGIQTYTWTHEPNDCLDAAHAIVFSSGNHGWKYFCQVK